MTTLKNKSYRNIKIQNQRGKKVKCIKDTYHPAVAHTRNTIMRVDHCKILIIISFNNANQLVTSFKKHFGGFQWVKTISTGEGITASNRIQQRCCFESTERIKLAAE